MYYFPSRSCGAHAPITHALGRESYFLVLNLPSRYAEFFTDDNDGPAEKEVSDLTEGETTVQLETLTVIGGGELTDRRKKLRTEDSTTTTTTTTTTKNSYDSDREKNISAAMPHLTEFEKYDRCCFWSSPHRDILGFALSDDSEEMDLETQINKLN